METDSFFCQLLKQLPETLFELLGLPPELATHYRFDSVELKKSFRIDGVCLPERSDLPVYFVEVQFQRLANFYANIFAKAFSFLHENDPGQDWLAVAIFDSRRTEPTQLGPYEVLLNSRHVVRIYLDEYKMPSDPSLGLGLLKLVSAPEPEVKGLVRRLVDRAENDVADSELARKVIELVEELLLRRFTQLNREEIRIMFQLHDLRESKVWQEAHETGIEEGIEKGRIRNQQELIQKWLGEGKSAKEIASLMGIPVKEVRRLAKHTPK